MPYDELGNYIPGDEPSLDQMRYELSLPQTVRRMVSSPTNDLSALSKAQTYKDIASGFGSAGESLVRGAGAAALGVTGDILKHFQETPFIPGVTDKISLNNVFPGAEHLMPKQEQTYELPVRRHPNMSYPEPRAKQEILGLPYATTSDILEAAPGRMTAPFGDKTANDFMEALGMFLQPSMQAGARRGIINMVETTGRMPSLTKDSAQAFARDYVNAINGVYPETPTMGSMAADFARQSKKMASSLEDITYGNYQRAQVRRAAQGVPEEGAYDPLRQRREAQAAEAYSVPEGSIPRYAVRPGKTGNQVIREVPTALNPAYNVTNESLLTDDLSNIVNRTEPTTQDERGYRGRHHFTNMVPEGFNQSAQDMFHNFIMPKLQAEFPNIDPELYSQALGMRFGQKNANEWYKKQLEEFALTPEAEAHNKAAFQMAMSDPDIPNPFQFLEDVLIIPPSVHFEGRKAGEQWVMNNFQDYLVEHLGTPSDPLLKLTAETGRTGVSQEAMQQLLGNKTVEDRARVWREEGKMPTQGTFEPEIGQTRDLLGQNNLTIQLLQDKENALIEANPGVRPQDIPGWKEARKEVTQATKRKDETVKKLDNLLKAQALENYNDTMVRPRSEEEFTERIEEYQKERFPMLPTGSKTDMAYQLKIPSHLQELAKDVQRQFLFSGAPGIKGLPKPADVGSYSVPKAVQIKAELLANKEKLAEKTAKANEEKLMRHTKARMEAMPQEGTYGPATVVRIDKTLSPMQIKSDVSDITYWMDHCIGRGGSPDKKTLSVMALSYGPENVSSQAKWRQYTPSVLSHLNNRVPSGSSGAMTSYMTAIERGEAEVIDFRDTATGIPYATLNLKMSNTPGKYRFGEFYGYQDHAVIGPLVPGRGREYSDEEIQPYRQAIADWANSKEQWLDPASNDYLIDNAEVYDLMSNDHQSVLARQLGVKNIEKREMVHSMGKRFVTEQEAKKIWNAAKSAPQDALGDLVGRREELEIELREAEDPDSSYGPEAIDDLRSRIDDLNQRIAAMENRPPVGAREVARVNQDWEQNVNTVANPLLQQLNINDRDALLNIIEVAQDRHPFVDEPENFIRELSQAAEYFAGNSRLNIANTLRPIIDVYSQQMIVPQTAQLPTIAPETINFLANDIVRPNTAFRNQVVENAATAIRDELLPPIVEANPTIPNDREFLERTIQSYQTSPLDMHLGRTLEEYIGANPNQENQIRERVADFMIEQIQQRLGNRAPQPAQLPAVPERAGAENVAPLVRNALNALPNLRDNSFVTEIVAQQVVDLSGQVSFGRRPQDFVQQLRDRAQMLEEAPPTRETNPDDRVEAARQMRLLANNLSAQERTVQNEVMQVNDPYVTIRNAHQHLINAGDVEGMEATARNIMENRNGPYGQLNDTQRIRLRRDLYNAIDRTLADREITPLEDIVAMDMNRTRDHYGEEVEQRVDNVLTAINDNYDIQQDPALFIERVRQNADVAIRNNDPNVGEALTNLAGVLTQTLRENTQIQSARNRVDVQENNEPVQPAMTDGQLDNITSRYLNNLENPTSEMVRQEASDMRNGMTDLPEFREITPTQRTDAQNEIAMRMEQHADMMDDMEPPEDPNLALPVPVPERTPEQNAMNEALHHPRWWMNRYPDIPRNIVYDILGRVRTAEDLQGMRVNARNRTRGTIFAGLHGRSRDQAVAMIDDIGNDYQNELQRLDAMPQHQTVLFSQQQYGNPLEAFNGILQANNQFAGEEGLNTLRALPQLLRRQNLRHDFGIENLSQHERDDLIRHFEIMIENRTRQLPPPEPEGHKRGGYIRKKQTGGGVRGYSPMDEALNQPGLKYKFTEEDILRNYGDSVFESYDKAHARKRLEPVVLRNITQPNDIFDDGQSLMNRRSVPLGTAQPRPQPSGQSFEDLQRQHMNPLGANEVMGHRDMDAMRYELLRKQ